MIQIGPSAREETISIVEKTDTATHAITAGQYVVWKGVGCVAASDISVGDTLSSSNLTAVSNGIANDIKSKIPPVSDSLSDTSTTNALSAAQGKALNDSLTTTNTNVTNIGTFDRQYKQESTAYVANTMTWADGFSFYIPAKSFYMCKALAIYNNSYASKVGISASNSTYSPFTSEAEKDISGSGAVTICGYTPVAITLYPFAMHSSNGYNNMIWECYRHTFNS